MSYTITPGFDTDDYIITLADGRVIAVDALTFEQPAQLVTEHVDTETDVDGLIANATTGSSTLLQSSYALQRAHGSQPQMDRFRSRSSPPVTWSSRWTTARNPSAGLARASGTRPAIWPQS